MPECPVTVADAVPSGVRLTLAVRMGEQAAEVVPEPGHCERLFRMAAYGALRARRLPGGEPGLARLVPAGVRDRPGPAVSCRPPPLEPLGAGGPPSDPD